MLRIIRAALLSCAISLGGHASALEIAGTAYTGGTDYSFPYCCYVSMGTATTGFIHSSEYSKGMADFDLAGLTFASHAELTLRFADLYFYGFPEPRLSEDLITINYYRSNNVPEVLDINGAITGQIATFAANAYAVGDTLTFDVTESFNHAVSEGYAAYGLRIVAFGPDFRNTSSSPTASGASFDSFVLSVEQTPVAAIPEPETYAMLLFGLGAIAIARKRASRRAIQSLSWAKIAKSDRTETRSCLACLPC